MTTVNRHYTIPELLKRFLPYYKTYMGVMAFDLLCAALTTFCELVFPLILRRMANLGIAGTLTLKAIGTAGLLYLALRLIEIVAQYYMTSTGHIMGAYIETDMRRDAFFHLQKLSDSYYSNTKVGQIMSRITNDLFDITEFSHHCPEEYFIGCLKFIAAFAILLRIHAPLTCIVFAIIPVMIYCALTLNVRIKRTMKEQRSHIGELNASIEDSLLGVKIVKSFANEELEKQKFDRDNKKFLSIKKQTYKYMAAFHTSTRIFDGLMYLTVIVAGGLFVIYKKLAPQDLFVYTLYVGTLLGTVRRIVEFTEQFNRGITGIERFVEIMDTDIEIFDSEGAIELRDVRGKVRFENVSFEYPDNKKRILNAINLSVEAGDSIAVVGPSGSGKTTMLNLIPRFYDVSEGAVMIDGTDVRNIQLKSLRSAVGMVQQDVYLFSGSVYENILYGRPGASRDEVIEACRLAGAYDFITELENGLDSYVGERGVKLSGGQKQRISIARVFLKNPPILILDEATSSLDNQSERLVQKSLETLAQGRTTFTIAHRLSTVQNAGRILVLTEEGIVEDGTHKDLLEKGGVYASLYLSLDA